MKWTFVLLSVALGIAGNSGCTGCCRGYGTTYAQPAYPAPACGCATTPPVVYQPPAVVQMPATCSQCAPACGCQ